MQIQVQQLRDILDLVAPAVSRKTSLPATRNVLFRDGHAITHNLEVAISVPVPELKQEAFMVDHRAISETLKWVPGSHTLQINAGKGTVRLVSPGSTVTLHGGDADEFPPVPALEGPETAVDGDALLATLGRMRPYCSTDDTRPVLTGIHIRLGDDVEVAAADGFRLAWEATGLRLPPTGEYSHLGLPAGTVKVLQTLWERAAKQPDITVSMGDLTTEPSLQLASLAVAKRLMMVGYSNNRMCFRWGNVSLTSQLVVGDFPDYKSLIPGGGDHKVVVDAEQLLRALNQVSHVASAGSNIVRLAWAAKTLTVSARGAELGDAEVKLPASTQGEWSHIAFNWGLLHDYVTTKDGNIMLETTTPSSPGLFTYRGQPHVVIMPMFVQWDEESTEPPTPGNPAHIESGQQEDKRMRRRRSKPKAAAPNSPAG